MCHIQDTHWEGSYHSAEVQSAYSTAFVCVSLLVNALGKGIKPSLLTQQTATYWPQVPLTIAALLSHSAGLLNRGSRGPKPFAGSWFSLPRTATRTPTNWFQLTELQLTHAVCGTWLYNCLTATCFLWASQLHRIQPVHRSRWYPDIFDRMHLLFTQVDLLIDSSVEG